MPRFFLTVFAGPNGSGKSTLTDAYRAGGYSFGRYVNPDEESLVLRARDPSLTQGEADRLAQGAAAAERHRLLAEGRSLTYETVFSHPSHLDFIQDARRRGHRVRLIFVGTAGPGVNVERVRLRVAAGGHDVPEEKVRSRYEGSVANLAVALTLAHAVRVYDNTGREARLVATSAGGRLRLVAPCLWFDERVVRPLETDGRLGMPDERGVRRIAKRDDAEAFDAR